MIVTSFFFTLYVTKGLKTSFTKHSSRHEDRLSLVPILSFPSRRVRGKFFPLRLYWPYASVGRSLDTSGLDQFATLTDLIFALFQFTLRLYATLTRSPPPIEGDPLKYSFSPQCRFCPETKGRLWNLLLKTDF